MNKPSTYKLLNVSGGILLFAEVTVSISENEESNKILISEHVFDWSKDAYGVNRSDEFVKGARKGIEHVIKYLPSKSAKFFLTFTVERIVATEIDSASDTVAYAACFAAWNALGTEPISEPKIQERQILFE